MNRVIAGLLVAMAMATPAQSGEMTLAFKWGDIPFCTTGRPNIVGNPEFVLGNLPRGTDSVEFRLKDLDAPGYDHGGGKLSVSGGGKVPGGLFRYKSPCPPSGRHRYEWTATARAGGKVLGRAKARREYPE